MDTVEKIRSLSRAVRADKSVTPRILNRLRLVHLDLSAKRTERNDEAVLDEIRRLIRILNNVAMANADAARIENVETLLGSIVSAFVDSGNTNMRLPNLFIAGFGKCGTTSAHDVLLQSNEVEGGLWKEIRFFSTMDRFSENLYARFFPESDRKHLLDSTPGYIWMIDRQMNKLRSLAGNATFCIFTRDPCQRSVSAYFSYARATLRRRAEQGLGGELPTVEASLYREIALLDELMPRYFEGSLSYDDLIARLPTRHVFHSFYDVHLARFKNCLKDATIHVYRAEDTIFPNKYGRILEDIEIEAFETPAIVENISTEKTTVSPTLLRDLDNFFSKFSGFTIAGRNSMYAAENDKHAASAQD